jgi:hypothetical protein
VRSIIELSDFGRRHKLSHEASCFFPRQERGERSLPRRPGAQRQPRRDASRGQRTRASRRQLLPNGFRPFHSRRHAPCPAPLRSPPSPSLPCPIRSTLSAVWAGQSLAALHVSSLRRQPLTTRAQRLLLERSFPVASSSSPPARPASAAARRRPDSAAAWDAPQAPLVPTARSRPAKSPEREAERLDGSPRRGASARRSGPRATSAKTRMRERWCDAAPHPRATLCEAGRPARPARI